MDHLLSSGQKMWEKRSTSWSSSCLLPQPFMTSLMRPLQIITNSGSDACGMFQGNT